MLLELPPPVVVLDSTLPDASLTVMVMEPSALNVSVVVVVEEDELPPEELPDVLLLAEDVPKRLVIPLVEREEDINNAP